MRPLLVLVLASGCVGGADRTQNLDGAPRAHPTDADLMAAQSPQLVDDLGEFVLPPTCDGLLESTPSGEQAPEDADAARARFVEASAVFAAGDYIAALEAFCEAHRLYPAPALLFNVAVTLERLGRSGEAAACYEAFAERTGSPMAEDALRRAAALRNGDHAP